MEIPDRLAVKEPGNNRGPSADAWLAPDDDPLHIHLIGVAGSGMSGIAGLLLALGHRVSGSDRVTTLETERLERLGLRFQLQQRAEAVEGADLVIYSSAIRPDNPAYAAAQRLGIPLIRRAEALARIMSAKKGIVVAGTHGKTTTSALAAHVLRVAGRRPSHYVGAEIPILGSNACWDPDGAEFVAEGDESDGTLRCYAPEHAIMLNIEAEHLDFYPDLAAIEDVFRQLASQTRNCLFYCADDPVAARLFQNAPRAVSFGLGPAAAYRPRVIESGPFHSVFEVFRYKEPLGSAKLGVAGAHNIGNAMAVVALACELGVPFSAVASAFESFRGARRRLETKHDRGGVRVVDDYGHHPTEIRATLATVQPCARRVRVLFQPHRYSRTVLLKNAFATAFNDANEVVVTQIYPASEQPIEGVTGKLIVEALSAAGHAGAAYEPSPARARQRLGAGLRPGDLVLTLGAGDIHEQGTALARDLISLESLREHAPAADVRLYEPLGALTTFKAGGCAQFYAEPSTPAELAALLLDAARMNLPVMVLGRGSNLLVRDGGISGLVLRLVHGDFARIEARDDGQLAAGAGVRFKQLAAAARKAGLAGFEWMDGIPGSVGGGLRMNAGAMGTETFAQVISVTTMDRSGRIHERRPEDLAVGYRHAAGLQDEIAIDAVFRGSPESQDAIQRRLDDFLAKRKATQPVAASAGCIFKNPPGDAAGRLIDACGLKNLNIGNARVSEIHGNFIVNDGGASASEILALIERVRTEVRDKAGVELRTEIQIVGTDLPAF